MPVPMPSGSYVPAPLQASPHGSFASAPQHMLMAHHCPAVSSSYVPAPIGMTTSVNLTEGIPDPHSIEQQKQAYDRGLAGEMEEHRRRAEHNFREQRTRLKTAGEQQLQIYKVQLEEALKQQELSLAQQFHNQQNEITQVYTSQRSKLEHQAADLKREYQQRKMQEEIIHNQAEMQKDMQEKLAANHEQQMLLQQHQIAQQAHHELQWQQAPRPMLMQTQGRLDSPVYATPGYPASISSQVIQAVPNYNSVAMLPTEPQVSGSALAGNMSLARLPTSDLLSATQGAGGQLVLGWSPLQAEAREIACSHCGNSVMSDSTFCRHCGRKLQAASGGRSSSYSPFMVQSGEAGMPRIVRD